MPAEKLITESAMDGVNVIDLENNSAGAIIDHMDIWTSSVKAKSAVGRGSNKKIDLYGIKKLRELILEFAVRGKLVPQDPNDEPASVLLERIAVEKERLIAEGKLKKQKKLSEISDDERQFSIPKNWVWCRFDDICFGITSGSTPPKNNFNDSNGIPYLKVYNIKDQKIDFNYKPQFVDFECHSKKLNRSILYPGDVIMNIVGPPLGKIAIIPNDYPEWNCNQAITFFRPIESSLNRYIYTYLRGGSFLKEIDLIGTAGQDNISVTKSRSILLPTPPLKEQHRIVAKVDELMTLCDQLEKQTHDSIDAHQLLVETLLATLTNNQQGADFSQNWARLHDHFDTLFTTERSIDALKQTILQLAVMGKLVPQDPNDEPASKLLERIAKEKAQLIKDKKIKKQKDLPLITEEEKPFDLPKGWEWCRVGEITLLKAGFAYKSGNFKVEANAQVIRMGNIRPDNLRLAETPVFISTELASQTSDYLLSVGNILLTMTGTKGKRDFLYSLIIREDHLVDRQLYLNQRLCQLTPFSVDSEFLNLVLKDDRLLDALYAKSTGTANQANIGMEAISNWVIPLPSASVQTKIVAKNLQLMLICDQLKQRLRDSQQTQLLLTDAIVQQAL